MTTISDNFNRANSTTLGTSSEGWSWTEVAGDIDIVSNQASHQAITPASARAESNLASANHYAQATLVSTPNTTARGGVCVRYDSAANTYYAFWARRNATITYRLLKTVAGTQTVITDVNSTAVTLPAVLKLEVDGSTLRGYVDGTQVITATDTSITGGTRTGIFAEGTAGSVLDDFSAADLATGSTFTQSLAGSTTPSATLARQTGKPLAGSTTPSSVLARSTAKTVTGATTPMGGLVKSTAKTLTGSTTPSGVLSNSLVKLLALAGTVTPTGVLARQVGKALTGQTSPSGGLVKRLARAFTGQTTPTGALLKLVGTRLSGTVTPSGAVTNVGAQQRDLTLTAELLPGRLTAEVLPNRLTAEVLPNRLTAETLP